ALLLEVEEEDARPRTLDEREDAPGRLGRESEAVARQGGGGRALLAEGEEAPPSLLDQEVLAELDRIEREVAERSLRLLVERCELGVEGPASEDLELGRELLELLFGRVAVRRVRARPPSERACRERADERLEL